MLMLINLRAKLTVGGNMKGWKEKLMVKPQRPARSSPPLRTVMWAPAGGFYQAV